MTDARITPNEKMKKGRSADLISRRNSALVKRFYFWTEIKRRRFDDTLQILSLDEFFISEQTIENILRKNLSLLDSLMDRKPTQRQLKSWK
ncbi:MAG: hypothetical protein MI784_16395 [Cytophagales bacterium]|nr:hypothetical protein [Cytophagales bacterium]